MISFPWFENRFILVFFTFFTAFQLFTCHLDLLKPKWHFIHTLSCPLVSAAMLQSRYPLSLSGLQLLSSHLMQWSLVMSNTEHRCHLSLCLRFTWENNRRVFTVWTSDESLTYVWMCYHSVDVSLSLAYTLSDLSTPQKPKRTVSHV